ncbi:Stp1/IreP family PP2C-type Ser/Thr phosphatase [Sphaerisporangium fuscum]|uniref:Stp1/IreP family PP2C-type Ser/Thr phosphatase n=1 Tax=Sphaerisporangium fuscum TaxID=2835868 RepID=UPI001BDD9E51|nr:Stp1/IreP family PP2C-type Ser/Thr phosphatase [Sphaerisporangium fuscum]
MTIALRYAARSDVGLLREGNEDSAYASPRLLAVADGMGGHAHGEVASSVAITAMSSLDRDAFGGDLLGAIEAAVRDANRRLHEMVGRDPSLKGMGTTLTAMLWSGTRVALVHVGDSRAYLLRNGELYQITHDHTLVQSLVDDGRITQEEAASHPQRSILLRALDGSGEVDPDLSLREAQINDRYLLCSDGLSSVVSAETLHHTLTTVDEPESVVRQLIDLANRGGGPDNITCIVADVVEIEEGQVVAGDAAVVGAAGSNRLRSQPPDTPAGRASTITAPQPVLVDDDLDNPAGGPALNAVAAPRRVRRRLWPTAVVVLGLLGVVVGGGVYFGYRWTQDQYYVGAKGDELVLFRGVDTSIGPIQLNSVVQSTGLSVSSIPEPERGQVRQGISVADLEAGQKKINDLKAKSGGDQKTTDDEPSVSSTSTKSPTKPPKSTQPSASSSPTRS